MIYWHHGRFHENAVTLGLDSPAFRFGTGVFETLHHNGSRLCHLGLHLNRLTKSLSALGISQEPIEPQAMGRVIAEVMERNGLAGSPARINIYCMAEESGCGPLVTARPHSPRPGRTLRLQLCPEQHVSSLNVHKTMNHMFYQRAATLAAEAGFDGAALTDLSGNMLETNAAALVFSAGGKLVTPSAQPKLPSTALKAARSVLDIRDGAVHSRDLPGFEHVYALNSVMGMLPVTAIGETEYAPDEETCDKGTAAILCL